MIQIPRTILVLTASALIATTPVLVGAQSATNGVYGGYVGSSQWFETMRQSAANQAMLKTLGGNRSVSGSVVPRGYVEIAGKIVFPDGNPFPNGRLPDLRVRCRNPKADPVERAPFVSRTDTFYTVLKTGETYDFSWMYYFGSKERFASIHVRRKGPHRRGIRIAYRYRPAKPGKTAAAAPNPAPVKTKPRVQRPANADRFDMTGFPSTPTTFEEQLILEAVRSASTPALKADAHERLARYYQAKKAIAKARAEAAKARYWRQVGP